MKKILLATLALTTVAATSAMAAPTRHHMRTAPAVNSNTVIEEGTVRGTDPDPYVRYELRREVDPANANG